MGPLPSFLPSSSPISNFLSNLFFSHISSLIMDYDNVKGEKAKSLNVYKSIGFLFRVTEIVVALLLLCWIFTCLPFFVRISGEFLRRLACFVSTPLFMFVLGNSIVVALLTTKSSVFSASRTLDGAASESDIYDAFIRSGENRVASSDVLDLNEETTTVYDDKQMIIIDTATNPTVAREDHVTIEPEKESTKVYRRSKSEITAKESPEMVTKPSLRRSETEKCRDNVEPSCEEVPFPEDHLTNEEFQKTIEAFIAKQLIFRRRESLAVVIHNQI